MIDGEKFVTDRDKLLGLLNDFGIQPYDHEDNQPNDVRLEAYHGNVGGYYDFHCIFQFDDYGNFIGVGVWE